MDSKAIREVFNELFTHLERLETESAATLQFLKEKKRVTDKQLAPYLEQAGNAANVKWRAARVRIERLLTDEDEGDKKIEKKPEIAQAEQREKKQAESMAEEQSKDRPKEQSAKDQADKNQVASPELEAAVNRDTRQEPEQKKKVEPLERQPIAANNEQKESANQQKPAGDQQAQTKPQERKHEEANHPTEMTQDAVQRDSGKPTDEMKPKDNDQEAA